MSNPNAVKAKVCIPLMVSLRFPSGAQLSAETKIPAAAAAALQRYAACERENHFAGRCFHLFISQLAARSWKKNILWKEIWLLSTTRQRDFVSIKLIA